MKISQKFPKHQIIGEEYGHKNTDSEYSWVIDPIDGTRSYVVGNPSWSNLISLNFKAIYPNQNSGQQLQKNWDLKGSISDCT